jgi:hypothetical protein
MSSNFGEIIKKLYFLEENGPGRYDQDTTMADRYEWIFNKRAAC